MPSYLSNSRRYSLYETFIVVFLAPSTSMERLIPIMGGHVHPAYVQQDVHDDAALMDALERMQVATSRTVLIICPGTYTGSGTSTLTKTKSGDHHDHTKKAIDDNDDDDDDMAVRRRLRSIYRHMMMKKEKEKRSVPWAMVMHQELAASIIFTRSPLYLSEESIETLLLVRGVLHHPHDIAADNSNNHNSNGKQAQRPSTVPSRCDTNQSRMTRHQENGQQSSDDDNDDDDDNEKNEGHATKTSMKESPPPLPPLPSSSISMIVDETQEKMPAFAGAVMEGYTRTDTRLIKQPRSSLDDPRSTQDDCDVECNDPCRTFVVVATTCKMPARMDAHVMVCAYM
jgi:hypothetical protein